MPGNESDQHPAQFFGGPWDGDQELDGTYLELFIPMDQPPSDAEGFTEEEAPLNVAPLLCHHYRRSRRGFEYQGVVLR